MSATPTATATSPSAPGPVATGLELGGLVVDVPVVLAPMAGVTNSAFRTLCRSYGAGLYVSEMVTARALVEGNAKTLGMASFAEDETVRSVQLSSVDPAVMGRAVTRLVDEIGVDHIDLNFGCPAAKVTRQGAGAALPVHRTLFRDIVRAAVTHAGDGAGDRQAAHRGRRRPRHLPRVRPDRRGRGVRRRDAARPHGRAALLGRGRLGRHRPTEGGGHHHPRAGQRRPVGGGRRPGHDGGHRVRRGRGGPGVPRAAVAVPGPGRRLPWRAGSAATRARRDLLDDAGPPRPAVRPLRRGPRHPAVPQAHRAGT